VDVCSQNGTAKRYAGLPYCRTYDTHYSPFHIEGLSTLRQAQNAGKG
jgi:hypothetical protein